MIHGKAGRGLGGGREIVTSPPEAGRGFLCLLSLLGPSGLGITSSQPLAAQALRLLRGPHRQPEEDRPAPGKAVRLLPPEPSSQAGGFSSALPSPQFPPAPLCTGCSPGTSTQASPGYLGLRDRCRLLQAAFPDFDPSLHPCTLQPSH